jgi:hypothetical protein
MIKKLVMITALAMLLGSPTSYAVLKSGNDLVADCQLKIPVAEGYCYGYVHGAHDALGMITEFCSPDDVVGKQLVDIVMKYLKENPENLHYNAASLVTSALIRAFPCPD